jgi:hypothetical protein
VNFNVNFNVLLRKYIVHPLVKLKKDFDKLNKFRYLMSNNNKVLLITFICTDVSL